MKLDSPIPESCDPCTANEISGFSYFTWDKLKFMQLPDILIPVYVLGILFNSILCLTQSAPSLPQTPAVPLRGPLTPALIVTHLNRPWRSSRHVFVSLFLWNGEWQLLSAWEDNGNSFGLSLLKNMCTHDCRIILSLQGLFYICICVHLHRYTAVAMPMLYNTRYSSRRRVAVMIAVVWFLSFAISCPLLFGLNNTGNCYIRSPFKWHPTQQFFCISEQTYTGYSFWFNHQNKS